MHYAREHVKKYWAFHNKKEIGLAMIVFAISYSVGIVINTEINAFFNVGAAYLLLMWLALFLGAAIILAARLARAHTKTIQIMNLKERDKHSRQMGIFLGIFAFGSIASMLPVIFEFPIPSLNFLLSAAGILFTTYVAFAYAFSYRYNELAYAGVLFLISFAFGLLVILPRYYTNPPEFSILASLLTSSTFIVVPAVIGLIMVESASLQFLDEFRQKNKLRI